jgi:subtilisin family serine protease
MPKERKKIILKRKRTFINPGVGPLGTPRGFSSLAEPVVEIAALNERETAEAGRDPEVVSISDAMPLKLVQPVGAEPTSANTSGNTWGIDAVDAHTSPFDGSGITVAVLDTGIHASHDAFNGVDLIRRNFTTEVNEDIDVHGTHCAGTIFGRDIGSLRIGVARGVERAIIGKVLGEGGGGSDTLVQAITWAYEQGANIISMSLGIDFRTSICLVN